MIFSGRTFRGWTVLTLSLVLILTGVSGLQAAEGTELSAEKILLKMDQTMKVSQKYMREEMILTGSSGTERKRSIAVWNKNTGAENKMLVKFLSPANIAGTGVLMVNDDMWLYLPALGRVKRIAGSARQGSFMGSDLSYEDMEAMGSTGFSASYRAELLEAVEYKNRQAYKLKLMPVDAEGSYSRLEILVDQEWYLPLEISYYGQDGEKKKVLTTTGHREIDGHWTAAELVVTDLTGGSMTTLLVKEVDYNREIDEAVFTTRYLERGQ